MTRFLTWQQLHDRGILPSRQHTRRLIEQGILPAPYRLGDPDRGRLTWRADDIEEFIERRAAQRERPRRSTRVTTLLTADGNVVPLRRGPMPARPRFTATAAPKMVLKRPVR
jgi:predicted DNA-binding transcriptional regulator AlpA